MHKASTNEQKTTNYSLNLLSEAYKTTNTFMH